MGAFVIAIDTTENVGKLLDQMLRRNKGLNLRELYLCDNNEFKD